MLKLQFTPFPELRSERLNLRQVLESDIDEVCELRSDEETMRYIPRHLAQTREHALEHIHQINQEIDTNKSINWGISLAGSDKLIGLIGLVRIKASSHRAEIGYILHQNYRGRGIMTEALGTILNYAFNTLDFNSVIAVIDPNNESSKKLLERNRFKKEAHLRENILYQGEFRDTAIYGLLKKEY